MKLSRDCADDFQRAVWNHYLNHRRDLPWRTPALQPDESDALNPYAVLVSEVMLQQTQVGRVVPKYRSFLARFPSFSMLASAELGEVLREWNGLGYNRRAKYLWLAARAVVDEYGGRLPRNSKALQALPGIGKNTAGAILVYAFNESAVFIETNIRTVYIHHFFAGQANIDDPAVLDIVAQTMPAAGKASYREWYWALMDYGTHLKSILGNVSRASKHHTRQSTFMGSRRQIRGQVLKLLAGASQTIEQLQSAINDDRLSEVLEQLHTEGLIHKTQSQYHL